MNNIDIVRSNVIVSKKYINLRRENGAVKTYIYRLKKTVFDVKEQNWIEKILNAYLVRNVSVSCENEIPIFSWCVNLRGLTIVNPAMHLRDFEYSISSKDVAIRKGVKHVARESMLELY